MSQPVIRLENVSKLYRIGEMGTGTISNDFSRWWSKTIKGKDPFAKIGQEKKEREGDFWALKDINFEINQGDVLGIIGKNGAGKSTLLKILSRITSPTTGQVKIKGRIASLLEVGTGFHPELTGRDNVYLNGSFLGMKKWEIDKRFDEIIDFSGIEKFIDTPVKRYSSGMYVRLAFAVAAHLDPEILIIDEVLAVGDAEFQAKCLGKMQDVSKTQGRTVIFVSHQMGMISQLCNQGILLNKGNLEISGNIKTVIEKYITKNKGTIDNEYLIDFEPKKNIYFKRVYVSNNSLEKVNNFTFDENIKLNFEFAIKEKILGLQIGIAMIDKMEVRLFTVIKEIEFFTRGELGEFIGKVTIPNGIIAPNHYSFIIALWNKNGQVYDILEKICPVQIHDSGTEHALYEGDEYGHIIIKAEWE